MAIGMFLAMALTLALPTGAAGGLVLLVCSIVYLTRYQHQIDLHTTSRHEFLFLGSLFLYPLAVVVSCLALVDPILGRHFDNPLRFLLALPIYWAIRKSGITPDALVIGAITGASIAGILAIYQGTILEYDRSSGFTNSISFAHITLLLICIALIPVSLPVFWHRLRACGVGLGMIALFLSQTLGAWIAIPALVFLMRAWFYERYKMNRWWIAVVAVASIGLLFLIFQMKFSTEHERIPRQNLIQLEESGWLASIVPYTPAICRAELWKAGWTFFSRHPWTGIGFDQYGSEVRKLQEEGSTSFTGCVLAGSGGHGTITMHAHNDFIEIAATMGGLAISTYLLPLILIFYIGHYCCRRHEYDMGTILKVCAVAHGIFSLTQSQFQHNISTTFFILTAVTLVALAMNRIETGKCPYAKNTRSRRMIGFRRNPINHERHPMRRMGRTPGMLGQE